MATNEDFQAFAAAQNFRMGILAILQGHVSPTLLAEHLILPSIADKGLEKKIHDLVKSTIEIAESCHLQRKVNF